MRTLTQAQAVRNELKCCICGRFIAYADFDNKKVGWNHYTSPGELEPRDPLPYHKGCKGETK